MAQLIVRQIEVQHVRELKEQAGRHGVSMEEEHPFTILSPFVTTPSLFAHYSLTVTTQFRLYSQP